jgi:cell division protein FtsB
MGRPTDTVRLQFFLALLLNRLLFLLLLGPQAVASPDQRQQQEAGAVEEGEFYLAEELLRLSDSVRHFDSQLQRAFAEHTLLSVVNR